MIAAFKDSMSGLLLATCVLLALALVPDARASSSAEPEEGVVEEGPFYLELKPLSVPIRRKNGDIRYYMFMTVSLEFDEKEKKDGTRKLIPRVRDAFLKDLSGRTVLYKDKTRGVDYDRLKKRLLTQANQVLGKKAPSDILVVKVFKGN
ncbi:MAG: hypothetical protein ACJAYR_002688 [Sneathiella sp.]|jgi:hypothetical protein